MRIGNLEFRIINPHDTTRRQPEIICWLKDRTGKEFCITILWFLNSKEDYSVQFVGNRPFNAEQIDKDKLWELMRYGQATLDAQFNLEYKIKSNEWDTTPFSVEVGQ